MEGILATGKLFEQQSHHCGIETNILVNAVEIGKLAAIAPLWD